MEKNLKYPIKYAIQELKEHGGWEHNYEDITIGFITSICYVINQNTRYYPDGTNKTTYQVVFPYKDIHTFKYRNKFIEEPDIPYFSIHNTCLNSNEVTEIFETYEEAFIATEKANINMKKSIICKVSEYEKHLNTHNKNLEICKLFEQLVLEKTTNMIINTNKTYSKKLSIK